MTKNEKSLISLYSGIVSFVYCLRTVPNLLIIKALTFFSKNFYKKRQKNFFI